MILRSALAGQRPSQQWLEARGRHCPLHREFAGLWFCWCPLSPGRLRGFSHIPLSSSLPLWALLPPLGCHLTVTGWLKKLQAFCVCPSRKEIGNKVAFIHRRFRSRPPSPGGKRGRGNECLVKETWVAVITCGRSESREWGWAGCASTQSRTLLARKWGMHKQGDKQPLPSPPIMSRALRIVQVSWAPLGLLCDDSVSISNMTLAPWLCFHWLRLGPLTQCGLLDPTHSGIGLSEGSPKAVLLIWIFVKLDEQKPLRFRDLKPSCYLCKTLWFLW